MQFFVPETESMFCNLAMFLKWKNVVKTVEKCSLQDKLLSSLTPMSDDNTHMPCRFSSNVTSCH